MTTKQDAVDAILAAHTETTISEAESYAPANIALCKYWGKRDSELNLPITSSLSMSLGSLGSRCKLSFCEAQDRVILNGSELSAHDPFVARASKYLDLFRNGTDRHYLIETTNTIPTAAGFASSASGFASLALALNTLHGWELTKTELSILARLGSGSASRSLWHGFVEWHSGSTPDGMDSFAEPLETDWNDLRIGLLVLEAGQKPIGSREAMQRTIETSALYKAWPGKVATDIRVLKKAITSKAFDSLGATAESNALTMHATMMAAWPPVVYWLPESVATMHKVWACRKSGLPFYLTMDAGPNIKLLFQEQNRAEVLDQFPTLLVAE